MWGGPGAENCRKSSIRRFSTPLKAPRDMESARVLTGARNPTDELRALHCVETLISIRPRREGRILSMLEI